MKITVLGLCVFWAQFRRGYHNAQQTTDKKLVILGVFFGFCI
jgi:hypothetical protein